MEENQPSPDPEIKPEEIPETPAPSRLVEHTYPVGWVFLIMVGLSLLGVLLSSLLTLVMGSFYGLDPSTIASAIGPDAAPDERSFVRWMLALNHLGMFILPGVLTLWICYPGERRPGVFLQHENFASNNRFQNWLEYLRANRPPQLLLIGLGILLLLTALPLVHYLYGVNKALPLPEWMRSMESQTTDALKGILVMDTPLEMLANVLIMAAIPAFGEELVFRGILQQQLQRLNPNAWVAILLSALIFSAIHLQFEGFLPRFLLGVVLGWLFWRTQNFWVPVVAHFFNNAFQVVGQYLYGKELSTIDLEQDIEVPVYVAAVAVFLMLGAMRLIDIEMKKSSDSA